MRHHAAARLAHHVSDEGDDQEDPLYRLLPEFRGSAAPRLYDAQLYDSPARRLADAQVYDSAAPRLDEAQLYKKRKFPTLCRV